MGEVTALAGFVGGQAREQEAWTPDWVLDAARTALGGRIGLDPCGASAWALPEVRKPGTGKLVRTAITGGWFADLTLTGPGGYEGPSPHGGWCAGLSGLDEPWAGAGGVFVNPPYDDLQSWLKAMVRAYAAGVPVVGLFPVRPRRPWWVDACTLGTIVFLSYDVRFQGYSAAHPENMCIVTWGCTLPDLGKRETWRV